MSSCFLATPFRESPNLQTAHRFSSQRMAWASSICVIGADGLHSNVRRIVFGEELRFLRDLGLYLCVYSVPNYLNLDRMEIQYSELGRIAAIWSSRGDANAKACFGFAAPSLRIDLRDRAQQQQALRTVYEGIGWEVPRLLEMMPRRRTGTLIRRLRSTCPDGRKAESSWWETLPIALRPCPGKARVSHSSAPMCSPENWRRRPALLKLHLRNIENVMRPFVEANQALGLKSAKLMRSGEKKVGRRLAPQAVDADGAGPHDGVDYQSLHRRITQAANAIRLKDYSASCKQPPTRSSNETARAHHASQ